MADCWYLSVWTKLTTAILELIPRTASCRIPNDSDLRPKIPNSHCSRETGFPGGADVQRWDADNARTRAQRLRLLAKFIVGDEKQMLIQANLEEGSAKTYEGIAQRLRKEWGL